MRWTTATISISASVTMARNNGELSPASQMHITLDRLRSSASGSELLVTVSLTCGELSEERHLVLSMEQYCEMGLRKGELTPEAFEGLERAAELHDAVKSGERILACGANTAKTLAEKLVRRGFSRTVAAEAAGHLADIGIIDEERDIEPEVRRCLRKLWGERRIRQSLLSHGYSRAALERLPELLEEVDLAENCRRLIEKHYSELPADAAGRNKLMASLARYGYSAGEIREAMRRFATEK